MAPTGTGEGTSSLQATCLGYKFWYVTATVFSATQQVATGRMASSGVQENGVWHGSGLKAQADTCKAPDEQSPPSEHATQRNMISP